MAASCLGAHGRCTRPPAPGRKTCQHHLDKQRARYQSRKAACAEHGPNGTCAFCEWAARQRESGPKRQKQRTVAKYGITAEQYDEMLAAQGGVCATCGQECTTGRPLAVDHCHATGRVRGLLCVRCNSALGMVRDDVSILCALIDYLKE